MVVRVRVFDKQSNSYFKSEVYAIINSGIYERFLVIVPSKDGDFLKFFDSVDAANNYKILINTIPSEYPAEWVHQKTEPANGQFGKFSDMPNQDFRFYEYRGFEWLWNEKETLCCLLNGEKVRVCGSVFEGRLYSDHAQPGWNYIENTEDAENFLEEVCDLHDSVITEINYVSGGGLNDDGSLTPGYKPVLNMKIQSQICGDVEMEFIGLMALNLRPAVYCFSDIISGVGLICRDGYVYFSEEYSETADFNFDGTWAVSYDLRWRFNN